MRVMRFGGTSLGLAHGFRTVLDLIQDARTFGRWTPASRDEALEVNLILAGATGGVGRALLEELKRCAPALLEERSLDIRVRGLLSSRGQLWLPGGGRLSQLPPFSELVDLLSGNPGAGPGPARAPGKGPVRTELQWEGPPHWGEIRGRITIERSSRPIFVDCTANPEVASGYGDLLRAGVPVVTPNKLALSGSLELYREIQALARRGGPEFRYETTVGAALPVLAAVRNLRASGDRIRRIRAVLSGTLSFVFNEVNRGVAFSEAVKRAREKGFTEPHPGEDLSGADVARKLLILAREAGWPLQDGEIQPESIAPPELAGEADPQAFLEGLAAHDPGWPRRRKSDNGGGLAYVAEFQDGTGRVGVQSLRPDDALAGLLPTENRIVVETERYREVPLVISGPGAGREVTAGGVLADLLEVVEACYSVELPERLLRGRRGAA